MVGFLSKEGRHEARDYRTEVRPDGATGCASCGDSVKPGVGTAPAIGDLGQLSLNRYRRSHDVYGLGSFGTASYSEYDDTISVFYEDSHRGVGVGCIRVYLADDIGDTRYFYETDSFYSGDTQVDGVYRDEGGQFQSLTLYDAQGAVTAVQADAVTATLRYWDGKSRSFEIFPDGTGDRRGRLIARTDRNGVSTTVAYQHAVGTLSGMDRSKYKQISTVTDPYGQQLAFTYWAQPYWTHWLVKNVTLPSGATLLYSYDTAHNLTSIDYPDGSQSSFTYGYDAQTQHNFVTYDDAGVLGVARHYTAWYTALSYQLEDGSIVSQSPGITKRMATPNGETTFGYWASSDPNVEYFYQGGNVFLRMTSLPGKTVSELAYATNYVHDEQAVVPDPSSLTWQVESQPQFQSYRTTAVRLEIA